MNETTKDKKVRILKALASIPGQTGSIDAIRRELKPPLDLDEIQRLLEAMWMESSIIPISRGYAFEGILVAKLSEQEQKYLKGKKSHTQSVPLLIALPAILKPSRAMS